MGSVCERQRRCVNTERDRCVRGVGEKLRNI